MRGSTEESLPDVRDHASIFLISFGIMLFQITLTRVLSVVVWYHFAFLTISMVMLGLGAPGVWFALVRRPQRYLGPCLLVAGLAVPAAVVCIVKFGSAMLETSVALIVLCVMPATISMGAAVCLLLMRAPGAAIARMYSIDLIGACLGAFVVIPLMHHVPTPWLAAGCGLAPLAALMLYGGIGRTLAAVGAVVLLVAIPFTEMLQVTRSKAYDESEVKPLYERWTPMARLTVFDETFRDLLHQEAGFAWGRGRNYPTDRTVRQLWLEQDGSAGTPITEFDGDLAAVRHLLYDVTTVGYQLRPPERVAIIGAGGGRDILSALLVEAESIDAVELNPHTIRTVNEQFGELSGAIYDRPGVRAVASEGRSHLTHTDRRYDLIQISLIDSWAASAAGAFALAENNLYTVEAFELYLARLLESGMISTSRWMIDAPRLTALARASLEAAGYERPERHIVLVAAGSLTTLLASPRPFDVQDLARLVAICRMRGFDLLYPPPPGGASDPRFVQIAEGHASAAPGINLDAPTDDSPYFFHIASPFVGSQAIKGAALDLTRTNVNLGSTLVLRHAIVAVTTLGVLIFFLPFVLSGLGVTPVRLPAVFGRGALFFAAIGAGFMFLENVLIQQFVLYLGHPSYATTVILATLLLGMGLGSALAPSVGIDRLRRVGWVIPFAVLALVSLVPELFTATLGWPLGVRIAISCLVLIPLGSVLGLFFPVGMLRFGDSAKPWFWAINGVFGVIASVMSLALSMEFGFALVGSLSALIYGAAWVCLLGK